MKFLLLFLLTSIGGGLGKLAGLYAGAAVAPGLGLLLQFVLGAVVLVASVYLAVRTNLIRPFQLGWTAGGGFSASAWERW